MVGWLNSIRTLFASTGAKVACSGLEDCDDDLRHYLRCDILWTVACTALKCDQNWLHLQFPSRIGFPNPCPMNLLLNGIIFETDHALRKDFSRMITLSVADEDFSDIQSRALFLANHFASEIT